MKLICPECRHENEPERIYCHDCGARLDRSAVAQTKPKEEPPQETQRRLRSLLKPRGIILRQRLLQGLKVLLGAILFAAVVQMLRAPDLPETPDSSAEMPSQINLELEDAAMAPPGGPPLRYTQDQVNAYLAYRFKTKRKSLSDYLQFERGVIEFDDKFARFTVERSLLGFSVFTSARFTSQIQAGTISVQVLGGKIGRLPLHPKLMAYTGIFFSDVRSALDRECKSISKMGAIEFQPKAVVLARKAAQVP